MKLTILKSLIMLLIMAGLSSCGKNDIDYSNIENLYAQPLPVIQKAVQGKWKWLAQFGGVVGITYPKDMYVDIDDDHFIIDYEDGSQRIYKFTWKRLSFVDKGINYNTWVMWDNKFDWGIYYFTSIKNDTLGVGHFPPQGVTFNQFSSSFIRIK